MKGERDRELCREGGGEELRVLVEVGRIKV